DTGASIGMGHFVTGPLARRGCAVARPARGGGFAEELLSDAPEPRDEARGAGPRPGGGRERRAHPRRPARRHSPAAQPPADARVGPPSEIEQVNVEQRERVFRINHLGVLYSIDAVLPDMLKRGKGHLAAVSSLGAYRALPGQQAYCASKAAVNVFLDGL